MADYFISPTGSDSTGTGSASNPWKTLGFVIGSSPAISLPPSGTTRVIAAGGGLFRETVSLWLSPTSSAPLEIIGDVDGSLFSAGGASSPTTGPVEFRAWTDDATVKSGTTLDLNGKSHVTIKALRITGGSLGSPADAGSAIDLNGSTNIVIRECEIRGHYNNNTDASAVRLAISAGTTAAVTIDRCVIHAGNDSGNGVRILAPDHATDYDVDVTITNCLLLSGRDAIRLEKSTGSASGRPTGVEATGCTFFGVVGQSGACVRVSGFSGAGSTMLTTKLCAMIAPRYGFSAAHSSQISEDYNVIQAYNPRYNVTAGSNSKVGLAAVNLGLSLDDLGRPRPFCEPLSGSLVLGFMTRPSGLTVDLLGRSRPNPCAAGCLERVDPTPPPGGNTYIFQTEG